MMIYVVDPVLLKAHNGLRIKMNGTTFYLACVQVVNTIHSNFLLLTKLRALLIDKSGR
ncbi:TPA: hypothetical protein RHY07_002621 [Escherichia coli]|nr:hypothetical protein [Escherichia coli]HDV2265422.1 hypothetical protein [Escherichia coli]HDV2283557.1 hypothetical protein [Escherichia coli]HDV2288569.1 hypothetical protein [Escherichia coli]